VHGTLRRQCYWPIEPSVWSFCPHRPQGNHAARGVAGADDDKAWDVNLRDFLDTRRPVFAVAPGRVVSYGGTIQPGDGRSAGVLIEHRTPAGERWWSGYLHMRRDSIAVREGDFVEPDTFLGRIGRSGTEDNHLHFVVYDGVNQWGGLRSLDAELHPRGALRPLQRQQIARGATRSVAAANPEHAQDLENHRGSLDRARRPSLVERNGAVYRADARPSASIRFAVPLGDRDASSFLQIPRSLPLTRRMPVARLRF
jgi:hypothetical protein